eukprot:TRINITY_DN37426_c0_g1_i1.p1 TRINITY_DN37426_c0_g1~~TRINITY_DN37426_c0_g1_i1.p1  ORF type:complete len:330 (+),score=52.47 TRINITY_DN37426_c0_g1_i1:136-1125(+)
MAAAVFALDAGSSIAARRPNSNRAAAFVVLAVTAGVAALCSRGGAISNGFVSGSRSACREPCALRGGSGRRESASVASPRQANYGFKLGEAEGHNGLLLAERDGAQRVSTEGSFLPGHWNTVLGDKEIPASGRHYWEVKLVRKPSHNAWEYIGVAEPDTDVTVPLIKNKKAKGWFWGANGQDSFVYTHTKPTPAWHAKDVAGVQEWAQSWVDRKWITEKSAFDQIAWIKDLGTGPGVHLGQDVKTRGFPPFDKGTTVGVDVDMDDGSLAFWADGNFLGVVRDLEGKPIDLKGKKLVPALSVFGRRTGVESENSVMEVRSGLAPPTRPGK